MKIFKISNKILSSSFRAPVILDIKNLEHGSSIVITKEGDQREGVAIASLTQENESIEFFMFVDKKKF